jgi:ferrous iron transport protein A
MTHGLGGPVLLKVESSDIAIGKDIAEKILVRR